jgi:hypothetical protein
MHLPRKTTPPFFCNLDPIGQLAKKETGSQPQKKVILTLNILSKPFLRYLY